MANNDTKAVAHAVFFSLSDRSQQSIDHLAAECRSLEGHDGVQYFNVGIRGDGFDRPVNDQDYDVALYLVFENRAAHDAYQVAAKHKQFIENNKETWSQVRIFDSLLG